MPEQPKKDQPPQKEKGKRVEKDKPLGQKVEEVDNPPAGPATVVIKPT